MEEEKGLSCVTLNGGIGGFELVHDVHRGSLTRLYSDDSDCVNRVRGTHNVPDLRVIIGVTGTLRMAISRLLDRDCGDPRIVCLERVTRHVRGCPMSRQVRTYRNFGTFLSSLRGFKDG